LAPVATVANTVSVGSTAQQRRVVNVADGTGATDAVNLRQLNVVNSLVNSAIAQNLVQDNRMSAIEALNSVQNNRLTALEGSVGMLFDLSNIDRKDNRQGIAAAMAQADAPFPSAPGKTSYAGKAAVYRGEVAFSLGLTHRLNTESPFALTASVSHSGGTNTGATVGFAGEF
jgi:autotransporter adhesin